MEKKIINGYLKIINNLKLNDNTFRLIGMSAGTLQILCKLPQIFKILKTRNVEAISLLMFVTMDVSMLLWLVYSILAPVVTVPSCRSPAGVRNIL